MSKFRFFLVVFLIASGTLIAGPETISPRVPPAILAAKFQQFDKNGDGELRGDELKALPWLKFLDADGNGGVTLAEAEAALGGGAGKQEETAPALPPAAPESPREGPQVIRASECGVGTRLPDLKFTSLDGKEAPLWSCAGRNGLVVALVSPDCPVSKRYMPTLSAREGELKEQGIGLLLLSPLNSSATDLKAAIRGAGMEVPSALDPKGALAKALGARTSTEVFLFDAARTLVYRGAINDQYGLGYQHDSPRKQFLADAVAALLSGSPVPVAATAAPGCALDLSDAPALQTSAVTYHDRISRLIQANCQECHRSGGVAPFPLETYEQVTAKAGMINRMVSRRLMPPWFAAPPAQGEHSPWMNDRSLADRDRSDLLAWIEAGKPAGDPAAAPLKRTWPAEWQIGTPDLIAAIPTPLDVKATGTMPYQYATVQLETGEDKWVRGLEVKPTVREVVHHVLVFLQEPGKSLRQNGELGGFFAAYVPGNSAVVYPEGFAKPLPAGSKLIFQIHYTPNGTATQDQVRIGLLFAKEPPRHLVRVVGIANHRLNIPAGEGNYSEVASIPVPRAVGILGLMPHMHTRGKAFRYDVSLPDGTSRMLLDVPKYDFNWQLAYRYTEPLLLPAGAQVKATGWFDNSAENPANPDATKTVRWGQQTTDEMLIGYVEYFFTDEDARAAR